VPLGHSVQVDAPSGENVPGLHEEQLSAPSSAANVPAEHVEHSVEPS
jgi:hypothetical protein